MILNKLPLLERIGEAEDFNLKSLIVDRPFLFVVYFNPHNLPIFIGRLNEPTEEKSSSELFKES